MAAKKKSKTTRKSGGGGGGRGRLKTAGPAHPTKDMRVIILKGSDEYLRHLRTNEIREVMEGAFGNVDVLRIDGTTANAADALDECRSMGLMQQHKLVVIDDAERLVKEDARPLFERYAEAPSEDATLVLRSGAWRPGKLDKIVEGGAGAIFQCDNLSPGQAIKWAVNRAKKRLEATLEPDAAELLVDRIGVDLGRLDSEISKLSAAGEGGVITRAQVKELVGGTREEAGWNLQGAIMRGDPEEAMTMLQRILTSAKDQEVFVSIVLMDLARKLSKASMLARQGLGEYQAVTAAGFFQPARPLAADCLLRIDADRAVAAFEAAVETDRRMKTGFAEHRRAVESMTVRMLDLVR
ncbi:MAG: DNA polymerase III subunit delta [Planctomycetota bacterium]|nr:DNA polymerase III subunit delta [Planctomycetota bacterium]